MRPHFTDFATLWNIHSENFPSCRNDGWKRFAGFQFNNNQTLFAFLHPQLCIRFWERKVWVRLKEKLFSWKLLLSGRHLPFWHKILLETKHLSIPIYKVKYLQQQQIETLFFTCVFHESFLFYVASIYKFIELYFLKLYQMLVWLNPANLYYEKLHWLTTLLASSLQTNFRTRLLGLTK